LTKIERNYKDLGIDKNNFPSKSIFSTFTESTIQHRKTLLDSKGFSLKHLPKKSLEILSFLSENFKREQIIEFVEFLEIKRNNPIAPNDS